ncbi:MAG: ribonuclease P protein component [Verrucomicrobiota bacterium]
MADSGSPSLRFPQQMRLKRGHDFRRLKDEGQRLANGCLVANWVELPAGSASRLGVITGRKLGGAVQRSRARRLLREAFRLHQHDLRAPVDVVLVARPSILGRQLADVERDFMGWLRRARLLADKQ